MMDPSGTKTATSRTLRQIASEFEGTDEELLRKLRETYIGNPPQKQHYPAYDGAANDELDAPITRYMQQRNP